MPDPATLPALIDDEVVLRALTKALEEAVANKGDSVHLAHFGEPVPADKSRVLGIADLEIDQLIKQNQANQGDDAEGSITIEAAVDPALVKDSIYEVPKLAMKAVRALADTFVTDAPMSHRLIVKKVRRRYAGSPPEMPRYMRMAQIGVTFQLRRAAGR